MIDIRNWKTPNLAKVNGKKEYIVSQEIYPKDVFNLIKSCLNNDVVKKALLYNTRDPFLKNKQTSTKLKSFFDDFKTWGKDDNYYILETSYEQKQALRGRLFAKDSKSYCNISRVLRGTFAPGIYDDIDMVNCHPVLLNQWLKKLDAQFTQGLNSIDENLIFENKVLDAITKNREEFLKVHQAVYGIQTREEAKEHFLIPLNGGDINLPNISPNIPVNVSSNNLFPAYKSSIKDTLNKVYELCEKNINPHTGNKLKGNPFKKYLSRASENPKGKTINNVMTDLENTCLQAAVEQSTSLGLNPTVLCYDGFMIQRPFDDASCSFSERQINPDHLLSISDWVFEKTGFRVQFKVKDFEKGIDLKSLKKSIAEKEAVNLDDRQLGELFMKHFSHFVKIFSENTYYVFNDASCLWLKASKGNLSDLVGYCLIPYFESTIDTLEVYESIKKLLGSVSKTRKIADSILSNPRHYCSDQLDIFNSKTWLIPFNNKCVDVRTLNVRSLAPDDYFTYTVNRNFSLEYNFTPCEDLFKSFFKKKSDPSYFDEDTFKCFKRCLGYSMTGSNTQKAYFILIGESNSGKSTAINLLYSVLGNSIMKPVNQTLFTGRGGSNIETDKVSLEGGLRIGFVAEFSKDSKLVANEVKALTGDDPMSIRPMKDNERTFLCTTKFWVSTNNGCLPKMDVTDSALVNRHILFPFTNTYEKVMNFKENWVQDYGDACFSWLVTQAHEYFKDDGQIHMSETMKSIRKEQFNELNPTMGFGDFYEPIEKRDDESDLEFKKRCIPSWKLLEDYKSKNPGQHPSPQQFAKLIAPSFPGVLKVDLVISGRRSRTVYPYRLISEPDILFIDSNSPVNTDTLEGSLLTLEK